jgi:hypothetical protein
MDDESLKQHFEEIDREIAATDKRVDEVKWYLGGIGGLFSIWFAVLTLVLSWNYSNDKASLRDFQRDLREDLGKSTAVPELELLGIDGNPLEGQELEAAFETEKTTNKTNGEEHTEIFPKVLLDFSIKNSGNETTGPMTVVLYTDDSIKLLTRSIDERDFKYAWLIEPKYNEPSELPGQLTTEWYMECRLAVNELPPVGKHPALIKFFYGKGKVKRAKITIRVPQRP